MVISNWQLNANQLHTYLNLNDEGLLSLSRSQIYAIKQELHHEPNQFSGSLNCGNKISLRYSYKRYRQNACHNQQAKAGFVRYSRQNGYTGQFHKYLLTVNPYLFSAYIPLNVNAMDYWKQVHALYKQGRIHAVNAIASAFAGVRDELIFRNNKMLSRLTAINARVIRQLRKNNKIAVIDMGIGRPYEPCHGSVRLMYHLHYELLTTGRINKRKLIRNAKAGRNWSVVLTDHGEATPVDSKKKHHKSNNGNNSSSGDKDYPEKQDVNGTANPTPADNNKHGNEKPSGQSKWTAKKSRQTRIFLASQHRCPNALAEALVCYYYDHSVQNRLYWNKKNDLVKSYADHLHNCYNWIFSTLLKMSYRAIEAKNDNISSSSDYRKAKADIEEYRTLLREIISELSAPSARETLAKIILQSNRPTRPKTAVSGILENNTDTLMWSRGLECIHKMNPTFEVIAQAHSPP